MDNCWSVPVFVSFLFLYVSLASSQFPKKEKFYAVKEDLSYIRCETCQKAVKYLYRKTSELRDSAPGKKLEEDKIIELVEKSCNPDVEEGEWISRIDLVEKDGALRLLEQSSFGRCRRECKTVSRACEESVAEVDTDLAELLWRNKLSLSKLINEVCHSMSNACSKKPPKLKAGQRKAAEEFIGMSKDERKADKVLKQMRGVEGMPGMDMYSREDIEKMKELGEKAGQEREQSDERRPLYQGEGEGVSFIQMVMETLSRFWSWLKSLFGLGNVIKSDEL